MGGGGGGGRSKRLEALQEQTLEDEIARRQELEADLETRRRLRKLGGRRGQLRFFGPRRLRSTEDRRSAPLTPSRPAAAPAPRGGGQRDRGGGGAGGEGGGEGGDAGPGGGGESGGVGCFLAGTMILMADGKRKPIEQIQLGDKVASFAEDDPFTPLSSGEVRMIQAAKTDKLMRFKGGGGDIACTGAHRFLTARGDFCPLDTMGADDRLILEEGRQDLPVYVEEVDEQETVYNFTVWPNHTYVAEGYRVHNIK